MRQVGRDLNVRYVLEGSVQRGGDRMRVNVQLHRRRKRQSSVGRAFRQAAGRPFRYAGRDRGAARQRARAGTRPRRGQSRPSHSKPRIRWTIISLARRRRTKAATVANLEKRRFHYDRALALDPDNVDALVRRAWVEFGFVASWLCEDRDERLRRAEADLAKALRLRPDSATAHCVLGALRIYTNHVIQGIAQCERALAIEGDLPARPRIYRRGEDISGRSEETEAHILKALRTSPRDKRAWSWMDFAGVASSTWAATRRPFLG